MMKKILNLKVLALFIAIIVCGGVSAQGMKDIRINEVLVKNSDSFIDDYGHRSGWIELHNTGYSNVNVAGAHLSVKLGDKTKTYKIPKNDPRTNIPPQGYVVFFADGKGEKGTFYTNFRLDETGEIFLLDASGKEPAVDQVKYNINDLKENVSIGWFVADQVNGEKFLDLEQTTPNSTNNTVEFESRDETFRKRDTSGIIMALTAMSVVFTALYLLFIVFKSVGKAMIRYTTKKENKAKAAESIANNTPLVTVTSTDEEIPGDVIAAIGVAIRQYEDDLHDLESTVLTINKVARTYSPWSSKIYGTNNQPNRK